MFTIHKEEIEWEGQTLSFETGHIARQADGSVLVTYGETSVLATVVSERDVKEGIDFFPLTVNFQEKFYASGRIPGGYNKREGRPTERETLISRLIDRPIRPLFAKGYKNETQVVLTVLTHDLENDPDIVAMVAASAALTLSGVPFLGPIGASRVGIIGDEYIVNPTLAEMEESTLDLVVAGTKDAVLMVESEAHELPEEIMLQAVMEGHSAFQPVIEAIVKLAEKAAKQPRDYTAEDTSALEKEVADLVHDDVSAAYSLTNKQERQEALNVARDKVSDHYSAQEECAWNDVQIKGAFKALESEIVRGSILKTGKRIDERDLTTVRPIVSEVGLLPRTHGSALFTRGETQALVVATLGTGDDEQFVDTLPGTYKENFMLHYNFPSYSVGETGRMGSPGRREIGHGKLAWRAVHPMLPSKEEFPYTLRVVSEITESNGSSSMATVCGTSLALMDAGVPLKAPIAGIAMGLIKEKDDFAVLTDILGDEDHLGDMDFKVAGTAQGITSLQMDIKITGITEDIMKQALHQAKDGRLHILGEMAEALSESRGEVGAYAPRIETLQIAVDKIRDVIGSGGKVIREIVEKTGAKIDISDDGLIKVASSDAASIDSALQWIKSLTDEPEVGTVYDGTVVKTADFGAFVNFFGAKDGLVHISELAPERVNKTTDIVKEGDKVKVLLMEVDKRGKMRLSMKRIDQETGQPIEEGEAAE